MEPIHFCPGCGREIPPAVAEQATAQRKDLRCRCGALKRWQDITGPEHIDQPRPKPADSDTIAAGKAYIQSRLDVGVSCPCCSRQSRRYNRPLDAGIAKGLVALVRASPTGEIVHVKDIPEMLVGDEVWASHDFAKARYWGLCEEVPVEQIPKELLSGAGRKRRKGFWRSTDLGRRFVYSMAKVPKYISLVNNNFERCFGDLWSIADALGHPFDFYEVTGAKRPATA